MTAYNPNSFRKAVADVQATYNSVVSSVNSIQNALTTINNIANMIPNSNNSLFVTTGKITLNSANAVSTKINDSLEADASLLCGFAIVTTAVSHDSTVKISTDSGGVDTITNDLAIDPDDAQYAIKAIVQAPGVTTVDAESDIYLYSPAVTGRTAGEVYVWLLWKKVSSGA